MPWKLLLRITAILTCLVVVIVVSLPLWLPWLASPIAARFGVTWEKHQRIGYHSLELGGLVYARDNVFVSVDSFTLNQPLAWAWRVVLPGSRDRAFAKASGVQVAVTTSGEPRPPRPDREPKSLNEIFFLVDDIMGHVTRWAPVLEVYDASVKVPGLEDPIVVSSALWSHGDLSLSAALDWLGETFFFDGEAHWSGGNAFAIQLHETNREARIDFAAEGDSAVWSASMVLTWMENEVLLQTELSDQGQMPRQISLLAEDFSWPAELLQIPHYETLSGSVDFVYEDHVWHGETLLSLEGNTERFPPLQLQFSAQGDWEEVRLETLAFQAPWLRLQLSTPLALTTTGDFIDPKTHLSGTARLGEIPWFEAEGEVSLAIALNTGRNPGDLAFALRLESENLRWEDLSLENFSGTLEGETQASTWEELADLENLSIRTNLQLKELRRDNRALHEAILVGSLAWPLIQVEELSLETGLGSRLSLRGGWRYNEKKASEVEGEILIHATEIVEWLPEDVTFEPIRVSFTANGKWPELDHRLSLSTAELRLPHIQAAALLWESEGTGTNLAKWGLSWIADNAQVKLEGQLQQEISPWLAEVKLESFTLEDQIAAWTLTLEEATSISIQQFGEGSMPRLSIEELKLTQTGEQINGDLSLAGTLQWPHSGDLIFTSHNVSPLIANTLLEKPLPDFATFEFPHNELKINWDQGPLELEWQKTLVTRLPESPPLISRALITANNDGIRLNQWEIADEAEELIVAEGLFPIVLFPSRGPDNLFEIDFNAPLRWKAESSGEASFWKSLVNLTNIQLEQPRIVTDISGTLRNPEGRLSASFDTLRYISPEEEGQAFPAINDFVAQIQFTRDLAILEKFRFTSQGQELLMDAELPLGDRQWEAFITGGVVPEWRQLRANLEIPGAEIAAFSEFFPDIVSPQGEVAGVLRIRPGQEPEGLFTLRNAATRPMLPLGGLSNISGDLILEGRQLRLENLRGQLGGQGIRVDGSLILDDGKFLAYQATLKGNNLPIVRQPGMILRTDLDLALRGDTSPEGSTVLSGEVNLRDSFFLQEVRFQTPGSVTSPAMRPPFFSVDTDPVGDWELNLRITGQEFITVRSAIFNGVVNADLRMQGTLREPQAIGQVDVARGNIRFPFASLAVQEAVVRLTEENPFVPELFAQAQGRVFGYDVSMDLSGDSIEPIIEFTSTPPLSSEEVLLMITAGEVPEREIAFTGQQRAGRLAMFLGQNLLYELTGQDEAGERLIIESGNNISRQGRETFIIEYILTDRLSAIGEYDEYDAVNAGIKWRLLTR